MWVSYVLGQVASIFLTLGRLVPLNLLNHFGRGHIPQAGDVVISLTTHGERLKKVYLTLESLARGYVKVPIFLWLDPEDYYAPYPASLQRLIDRGVQVRCSDGHYGPHTKYWNQFREVAGTGTRVITVDDDIIYPEWLVEKLLVVGQYRLDTVVAYRAHRIELRDGHIRPYAKWSRAISSSASILHFATGVSGVLYPASFIDYVAEHGGDFAAHAPHADDVWLHLMELRSGHKVRQVFAQPRNFAVIPSTQVNSLVQRNLAGANDRQIAASYTPADVAVLLQASASED
ncbi:glycosyltransferase [Corynebacterium pyruviciproducens]|uniref:glycosyltransferase n=1 Tax=Corynebacterium pyruviciproducens TaxID=598660 RepID=UPI0023F30402|nr:glycosyltransferase [Corynebacterium pyruviciproducens]MDH4657437.1 glycosyltransferase [Corynebacterium pyruviciproducens]MDK6566089.1 glycosyltransferase [Corynebacterium pyruviciproducens]MDK7214553.1 glycosyltransferase [Corynebacterium pyruviciproducens]